MISCSMFRIKIQFYFYYLLLSVVRFPFTAAASPFNAGTKFELQESMHLSFTAMVRSAERSRSPKTSILPINHASLRIPASLHESRTCRAQCGISLWGTGGSTIHRLVIFTILSVNNKNGCCGNTAKQFSAIYPHIRFITIMNPKWHEFNMSIHLSLSYGYAK